MKNIRITLVRKIPNIKLFIDRFVESIRLRIHHIDYATDRLSCLIKMEARLIFLNVEKALINARTRFPSSIRHIDNDESILRARLMLNAKLKSIDSSIDHVRALLDQFAKAKHADIDESHVKAMLVYPVLLGELSEMTLGEMADKTLGDLTFSEIDI